MGGQQSPANIIHSSLSGLRTSLAAQLATFWMLSCVLPILNRVALAAFLTSTFSHRVWTTCAVALALSRDSLTLMNPLARMIYVVSSLCLTMKRSAVAQRRALAQA